jgi:hypothetical protein
VAQFEKTTTVAKLAAARSGFDPALAQEPLSSALADLLDAARGAEPRLTL